MPLNSTSPSKTVKAGNKPEKRPFGFAPLMPVSSYVPAAVPLGAWAIYRDRLKRFGSLIGDREPIVLHKEIPGMGRAKRYIITIADDDRGPLDKLCQKLVAADATCDVLGNPVRKDQ
jgi:hypothetical protein